MIDHACEDEVGPRKAPTRLLGASLVVAGGVLLAAWINTLAFSPQLGAGVIAAAGRGGGLLLRRHAPVPGLPLIAAAVMGTSILIATAFGGNTIATGGGALFIALMTASTARTRASALLGTAILAVAVILSSLI